jgi:resuscitation-promoting factor RpfB
MAGRRPSIPLLAPDAPPSDGADAAPVEWVKRSRLAFAMAVTVAAVPILVLDNLPASAARAEPLERPVVDLSTVEPELAAPTTEAAPTTTAPPPVVTTAPAAPPTTAAPVRQTAAAPTAPPTTEAPAPPPTAPATTGDPNDPATWDRLAQCEAGGNWSINTGNGYYGGLQFSLATWQTYGGTGYPHEASKATQILIGKRLQAAKGWGAWPGCARSLGYT